MDMALAVIEQLLKDRIGLSPTTIGQDLIVKAVQKRQKACRLPTPAHYLASLQQSNEEWDAFVETILVSETWFFRNRNAFHFLADFLQTEWLKRSAGRVLRMLSIPCSTGEEPYSIVMTLFESGFSRKQFQLDAVDLNRKALEKARLGIYGRESFRGPHELSFRERFFTRHGALYHIHQAVKEAPRFLRGNFLEEPGWSDGRPYDVIFCRNVLIYFTQEAKSKVIQTLDRLLDEKGLLFVGHAERQAFKEMAVEWVPTPGVFACRRRCKGRSQTIQSQRPKPTPKTESQKSEFLPKLPSPPLQFERRKTERLVLKQGEIHKVRRETEEKPYSGEERREPDNEYRKLLDAARLLADQGELQRALDLCERVLKERPANVQAHFLKGLIFQALRDENRAEEMFTKTIYLDPNHYDALGYLLLIAEHRGEQQKAGRLRQRMERIQSALQSD